MTMTSELHAPAERTNKQKRLHALEADPDPERGGTGTPMLKIPRGEINGVGEDEVTVNKQTEERGLHR